MHPVSYQLKRGHLCAVALGRRVLRGTKPPTDPDYDGVPDMTPARFDILYLAFGHRIGCCPPPKEIEMACLVRILGLSRATISKAVKRLVELGLVTCDHWSGNARNKAVKLTDEGAARIKRAMHLVFSGRAIARHFRHFIVKRLPKNATNLPFQVNERLDDLCVSLMRVARHLFDRSEEVYFIRATPDY